jgi:hypothetical protein
MSGLRPDNRALFDAARADYEPSVAERERVTRALGATLGVAVGVVATTVSLPAAGASASTAGTVVASGTASAVGSAGAAAATGSAIAAPLAGGAVAAVGGGAVVKWGIVLAVTVAALGARSAVVRRPAPDAAGTPSRTAPAAVVAAKAPSVVVSVPRLTTPAVPSPVPSSASAPSAAEPIASWPEHARPVAPVTAASAPTSAEPSTVSVVEEARLLREANMALQSGDVRVAMDRLDAHARAFPRGALSEEREVERVSVLCAAGQTAAAREAALLFVAAYPASPLAPRIRASCAGGSASQTPP